MWPQRLILVGPLPFRFSKARAFGASPKPRSGGIDWSAWEGKISNKETGDRGTGGKAKAGTPWNRGVEKHFCWGTVTTTHTHTFWGVSGHFFCGWGDV